MLSRGHSPARQLRLLAGTRAASLAGCTPSCRRPPPPPPQRDGPGKALSHPGCPLPLAFPAGTSRAADSAGGQRQAEPGGCPGAVAVPRCARSTGCATGASERGQCSPPSPPPLPALPRAHTQPLEAGGRERSWGARSAGRGRQTLPGAPAAAWFCRTALEGPTQPGPAPPPPWMPGRRTAGLGWAGGWRGAGAPGRVPPGLRGRGWGKEGRAAAKPRSALKHASL